MSDTNEEEMSVSVISRLRMKEPLSLVWYTCRLPAFQKKVGGTDCSRRSIQCMATDNSAALTRVATPLQPSAGKEEAGGGDAIGLALCQPR
ncbi:unnamed protein product [Arctogadus glacialis]